jgi:hypothetical protein
VNIRRKFAFSLIAFFVLGLLSWQTLSNDPIPFHESALGIDVSIRFRTAVVAFLALLAVLTALNYWRATNEARRESTSQQD